MTILAEYTRVQFFFKFVCWPKFEQVSKKVQTPRTLEPCAFYEYCSFDTSAFFMRYEQKIIYQNGNIHAWRAKGSNVRYLLVGKNTVLNLEQRLQSMGCSKFSTVTTVWSVESAYAAHVPSRIGVSAGVCQGVCVVVCTSHV
jgi:hypothetical protein